MPGRRPTESGPLARHGVRLAVDVGSVRVGVAASDPAGMLAVPVVTLDRGDADIAAIAELARGRQAVEVLVGLPVTLAGREGASARMARSYAEELSAALAPVPVRLVDERFSTVRAERALRASGVRGRARRAVVDQAAAVDLLQSVLDGLGAAGSGGGAAVPDREAGGDRWRST